MITNVATIGYRVTVYSSLPSPSWEDRLQSPHRQHGEMEIGRYHDGDQNVKNNAGPDHLAHGDLTGTEGNCVGRGGHR